MSSAFAVACRFGSNLDTPRAERLAEGQAIHRRAASCVLGVFRPEVRFGGTMGLTRRSRFRAKAANRRELAVERAAKKEAVEELHEVFKTTGVAVVAH